MEILNKLPKHLVEYVIIFLLPREINENFNVNDYMIEPRRSIDEFEREYIRRSLASMRRRAPPTITYNRFKIDLPRRDEISTDFLLSKGIHIIDTLIFTPHTEFFYLNELKLPLKNGVYHVVSDKGLQWFFAVCAAWLSEIVISPPPRAIIGGFITPWRRTNCTFDIKTPNVRYSYGGGGCVITG